MQWNQDIANVAESAAFAAAPAILLYLAGFVSIRRYSRVDMGLAAAIAILPTAAVMLATFMGPGRGYPNPSTLAATVAENVCFWMPALQLGLVIALLIRAFSRRESGASGNVLLDSLLLIGCLIVGAADVLLSIVFGVVSAASIAGDTL